MIIDLEKFIAAERASWSELEALLNRMDSEHRFRMSLEQLRHFHYLYERASADLARLTTFSSEPETRRYLESLVARAYGEIHETRRKQGRLSLLVWFFVTLPQTFRRHRKAFWLSTTVTCAGVLFGACATLIDPDSRSATMPFGHDAMDPAQRVAREEQATTDHLSGANTSCAAWLMTHHTKVAILTMALGMTWGVGTILELFQNGVALGAIGLDYMMAGQAKFLFGWILPHGVIEIPAILIAGQAGFILAAALIGWGCRNSMRERLRLIAGDLVTLMFGVAILLVWAGLVEAFLSQYHEPILPYWFKIAFGLFELLLLIVYLKYSGSRAANQPGRNASAVVRPSSDPLPS
jgi:uncharacterized membrane protein SpoIIM required for sporulation